MTNSNSKHPVYYIGAGAIIAILLSLAVEAIKQNGAEPVLWQYFTGIGFAALIALSVSLLVNTKRLSKQAQTIKN